MNKSIGIIIPALNEEEAITPFLESLNNCIKKMKSTVEVLIINDGSTDNTQEIVLEYIENLECFNLISNNTPKNIGYCYQRGIEFFNTDFITWLPADGEINPIILLEIEKILDSEKIIIPYPVKNNRNQVRVVLSSLYQRFFRFIFGLKLNYFNANSVIPLQKIKNKKLISKGFSINAELLILTLRELKMEFKEIPFDLSKRIGGKTKALTPSNFFNIIASFIRLRIHY